MSGSKQKKEKRRLPPPPKSEATHNDINEVLIEAQSDFDRLLSKPDDIKQAFWKHKKKRGIEIARNVEIIPENGLNCQRVGEWLGIECLGDKLVMSSPGGELFLFDGCSSEVRWSITTGKPPHVTYESSENNRLYKLIRGSYKHYKHSELVDRECHARDFVTNPQRYLNGEIVLSKSVTKIHVNLETGRRLSPLTSDGVQKLKEVTTDSSSDEVVCITRCDFELTCYEPGTDIILSYRRIATFNILKVSGDGAILHEKNDVPARQQGKHFLTQGRVRNLIWTGNGKDGNESVEIGEHNLGIDVIYIKKGQSSDDVVEREVKVVRDACDGNPNLLKVYDVVSNQDFHEVSIEDCDAGLRVQEFIQSPPDQKILLKLIRGIAIGLEPLHDKGIYLGDSGFNNIIVDKKLNAKILPISSETKFPLISSSTGYVIADDMLAVGHILYFGYFGVEYKDGDLPEPKPYAGVPNPLCGSLLNLLRKLLSKDRLLRPTASEIYNHTLFWDADMEFSFIQDVRVRLREEVPNSDLLIAIEKIKPDLFVQKWDTHIDRGFLNEMNKHSWYNYFQVRDLIRFIRNDATYNSKCSGQETDLHTYFPELVIKLYEVMKKHCGEELAFKRYFK